MTDEPQSRAIYPVRLEGVQITEAQNKVIADEAERRGGHRQRNGVVRDMIDFTYAHYDLFLRWIAARGNVAAE